MHRIVIGLILMGVVPAYGQSNQTWIEAKSTQYSIFYVQRYSQDVTFVRRWLNFTERTMRRKYNLPRHGFEVSVFLEPEPTSYAGVGKAVIFSGSTEATIIYLTPSARAWSEARRQGRTTNVGAPYDAHHHAKTLVHEYITLAHQRITTDKPRGFYYYSAPSWFVQGLEEYDGFFHSSSRNRTLGYARLLEYTDANLREAFNCCQTLSNHPAISSSRPYVGGTLILRFLADTFGEEVHLNLLKSPQPTLHQALAGELRANGYSYSRMWREFRSWFRDRTTELSPPVP